MAGAVTANRSGVMSGSILSSIRNVIQLLNNRIYVSHGKMQIIHSTTAYSLLCFSTGIQNMRKNSLEEALLCNG